MENAVPTGIGLSLRFDHFDTILGERPSTPWFEVITDDFLEDGPHHRKLDQLRGTFPISFHSVGLNVGGVQPFDPELLKAFQELFWRFEPAWISDHLCWSAHNGRYHHDLLPIPRTKAALENACDRINILQDWFGRELCIENITSYIDFKYEDFEEIEFLKCIVQKTGCKLLLDITNVLINHENQKKDPSPFLNSFPLEHVQQVHLAGGSMDEGVLVDSHSERVEAQDIGWLRKIVENGLSAPITIERDDNVPDFYTLEKERAHIMEAVYDLCPAT